jgi:hypothetical protein
MAAPNRRLIRLCHARGPSRKADHHTRACVMAQWRAMARRSLPGCPYRDERLKTTRGRCGLVLRRIACCDARVRTAIEPRHRWARRPANAHVRLLPARQSACTPRGCPCKDERPLSSTAAHGLCLCRHQLDPTRICANRHNRHIRRGTKGNSRRFHRRQGPIRSSDHVRNATARARRSLQDRRQSPRDHGTW